MSNRDDWADGRESWQDQPDPWDAYEEASRKSRSGPWAGSQEVDYETLPDQRAIMEFPHSGLGIASLVLTVFAGLGIFVTLLVAAFVAVDHPNIGDDDPKLVAIGCSIIAYGLAAVLGGILGVAGLFQANRRKVLAVIGFLLALFEISGIAGIMLVGLLAS